MNIQEIREKFKGMFDNTSILLSILIITVSSLSFYLGRLSVADAPVGAMGETESQSATAISGTDISGPTELVDESGAYVASKSGTKYHLPWCTGAKQIKESNKIWFETKEEAERAGYTPASNCKGI
jgi:hypothetical protein